MPIGFNPDSVGTASNPDLIGTASDSIPTAVLSSLRLEEFPTASLRHKANHWLAGLIFVSALLRVVLVLRGGQYYWPDEGRILRTWVVLKRPAEALAYILHIEPFTPSHWFYTILAIPFALVQAGYMWLRGIPLNTETVKSNLWMMALGTCLFSVACILIVYMIEKRVGATEYESLRPWPVHSWRSGWPSNRVRSGTPSCADWSPVSRLAPTMVIGRSPALLSLCTRFISGQLYSISLGAPW